MSKNIGREECEDCDGKGHTDSECCGAEVNLGCCSHCGEHAENADCTNCGGSGEVEYDIDERAAEEANEAKISQWESEREAEHLFGYR